MTPDTPVTPEPVTPEPVAPEPVTPEPVTPEPVTPEPVQPPPPSGITVNINGVELPKEDVIAFIHLGHSNMAGRASGPSELRPYYFDEPDLSSWMYRDGVWQPALEPLTAGDSGNFPNSNNPLGGPGTALVKQAYALAPNQYFVSLGFGKGSAYCSQFLPGALYYDQLIRSALELKGQVTFGAIVIMLGITERHGTSNDISGYPECINALVTEIRTQLEEPNLPVLVTDYEMEATGSELEPTGAFAQQMIPEIHRIPDVVSNSALVPTDGLSMQDDHHFDLEGYQVWVDRLLQIMVDRGWFPWGTNP